MIREANREPPPPPPPPPPQLEPVFASALGVTSEGGSQEAAE